MTEPPDANLPAIERLVRIMAVLRSPEGCPWDREQTLASLKPYLLEEAYEVLEAIDGGDPDEHCDELGDLLLQVVFQSQLTSEVGQFGFEDVAAAIADKLVRRHPHVFGSITADTPDEVIANWEEIKRQEKSDKGKAPKVASALDGITKGLPALLQAQELQKKAAKVGFDWPDSAGAEAKLTEELQEFGEAETEAEAVEELGDLLFAVVNVLRHRGVSAEEVLLRSSRKFRNRFEAVEQAADRPLKEMSLAEMDELWDQVKRASPAT